MKPLRLNTSYKYHLLIGLLISIWLVFFLVVIAPFDVADLPLKYRLVLMPFYGVISFVSYFILIPLQNWIFQKMQIWTPLLEASFIIIFNLIALIACFAYYKTSMVNGDYSFTKFTLEVYYPIFLILLSILIFARWFLFKTKPGADIQKIVLRGENKLDVLQINLADLVCVSSADNYVEISYLKGGMLHKKLLRNTLKNIHNDALDLVKVHRSYLINPAHFVEWKKPSTIILTQMEVPVSKKYGKEILALVNRP